MAIKICLLKKKGTGFHEAGKCQLGEEGIQGHWITLLWLWTSHLSDTYKSAISIKFYCSKANLG